MLISEFTASLFRHLDVEMDNLILSYKSNP